MCVCVYEGPWQKRLQTRKDEEGSRRRRLFSGGRPEEATNMIEGRRRRRRKASLKMGGALRSRAEALLLLSLGGAKEVEWTSWERSSLPHDKKCPLPRAFPREGEAESFLGRRLFPLRVVCDNDGG